MLVETKAVVHMALLFGSTWMVNSVVFFAVLVMILAANLFVLIVKPRVSLWPYYTGLIAALVANLLVPLDFFLGQDQTVQVVGSCLLVFTPILFAGVIFATSFAKTKAAGVAFGANIAGAACWAGWRKTPRCWWGSSICWWWRCSVLRAVDVGG